MIARVPFPLTLSLETMRIITLLLGVMFLGFAAVQYNDPDPYIWFPVYLFPALASALVFAGRRISSRLLLAVAGAYLVGPSFSGPRTGRAWRSKTA